MPQGGGLLRFMFVLIELCLSITSNEVELRARDRVVGGGRVVVRERAG